MKIFCAAGYDSSQCCCLSSKNSETPFRWIFQVLYACLRSRSAELTGLEEDVDVGTGLGSAEVDRAGSAEAKNAALSSNPEPFVPAKRPSAALI